MALLKLERMVCCPQARKKVEIVFQATVDEVHGLHSNSLCDYALVDFTSSNIGQSELVVSE